MALTGLQIFKLMPKTNCKECGHPTCLAFSMALATAKIALDACPHVSEEAKAALGAAAAPPVAKVVMGTGEKAREMGDETVLFRHDKQFFHPTCLAVTIADDLGDADFDRELSVLGDLVFGRVGTTTGIDGIALIDKSGDPGRFAARAAQITEQGAFAPVLVTAGKQAAAAALELCAAARPLLLGANEDNWQAFAELAKKHDCPLGVSAPDIDRLAVLTEKITALTTNLVIGTTASAPVQKLADLTQIRRQAIRKKTRLLGYPSHVSVCGGDPKDQAAEASAYIAKYASIVLMDIREKALVLPLCALRQNLFSDPQKPAQVEPGVYPVGEPDEHSPVYCTTNFSLTYYTVEGEVSGSRIPSWIVATPTDGTSVLTAWASGKFTPDRIAEFIGETGLAQKVAHRTICIPGHVAMLRAPLEEKSGWNVIVAPNEASGIPAFAKSRFA